MKFVKSEAEGDAELIRTTVSAYSCEYASAFKNVFAPMLALRKLISKVEKVRRNTTLLFIPHRLHSQWITYDFLGFLENSSRTIFDSRNNPMHIAPVRIQN